MTKSIIVCAYAVIYTTLFLILLTFFVDLIRRFYRKRRFRLLDQERAQYAPLVAALADGVGGGDEGTLKKKPRSLAWIAIEETLLKDLEHHPTDTGRICDLFCDLGYEDYYIRRLNQANRWEKAMAAGKLGRIGCKAAVPHLIRALQTEYREVRNTAVYSLGAIGDETAIPFLLDSLKKAVQGQEDFSVRIIKSALIAFGEKAVPLLLAETQSPVWEIRAEMIDVLDEMNTPLVAEVLRKALQDPEPEIRARAAKGLGKIQDPAALRGLIERTGDPSWVVRLHATRALGLIKVPAAIPFIRARMKDKNWQVRRIAGEALGRFGYGAHRVLLEVLLTSPDQYAREQAVDELERAGIIEELMNNLLQKDRTISWAAGTDQGPGQPPALGPAAPVPERTERLSRPAFLELVHLFNRVDHSRLRSALELAAGKDFSAEEIEKALNAIAGINGQISSCVIT